MLVLWHQAHRSKKNGKKHGFGYMFLDFLVYIASFLAPLATLPQLYVVWVDKNVSSISVSSWTIYSMFSAIWLIYGIVHKEKPIIISNALWAIVQALVAIGAVIYHH